ncbi:hypothetical protein ACWC0A_05780 [Streptomyces scopuliridis]
MGSYINTWWFEFWGFGEVDNTVTFNVPGGARRLLVTSQLAGVAGNVGVAKVGIQNFTSQGQPTVDFGTWNARPSSLFDQHMVQVTFALSTGRDVDAWCLCRAEEWV